MSRIRISRRSLLASGGGVLVAPLAGCADFLRGPVYDSSAAADAASRAAAPIDPPALADTPAALPPLFDDIERRTFDFFWATANPVNGMVPDRHPSPSPASIAAVGFALTAYVIGADRGYITRAQARERTLATVRFLRAAPQGPQARGATGHKGFFYHFLDMKSGTRAPDSELSTVDTALLVGGLLHAQAFFDGAQADEIEIRALVDAIYWRIDWRWAQARGQLISLSWSPEKGFSPYDWGGYNEAMLVVLLALGSPTHPVDASAWSAWSESYRGTWGRFMGYEHLSFAPLFGHQYSHVWIDFRGIQDDNIRAHGIDYFENSRRASLAQHAYGVAKYGDDLWGLTACDGPHDYAARGATAGDIRDDGTIAPTAAISSMPFTPELSQAAMQSMIEKYGDKLYKTYGFVDSFNPAQNWFDKDYLGIDQGPIICMIENHRSGLVWKTMRKNPHIVRGLKRAGFTGGWLQ